MGKRKLSFKIIDLIYWGIILCSAVWEFVSSTNGSQFGIDSLAEGMTAAENMMMVLYLLFISLIVLIFFMSISIFKHFYISALYFGLKIAFKRYKKDKMSKIDFKNDDYYRDILPNLSPGMLSYIDDFSVDERDIVATLMRLELKKKIKIGDCIEILDSSEDGVTYQNEKIVFEAAKSNTLNHLNIFTFKDAIIKDCLNEGLLQEKNDFKTKMKKRAIISVVLYICLIALFILTVNSIELIKNSIVILVVFLAMICMLLGIIIFPISFGISVKGYYAMNRMNPYIRNKKAEEINEKLEGLRKYIKDYGNMSEREKEELILWEDYLIYSVIFGENANIVENVMKIIQ